MRNFRCITGAARTGVPRLLVLLLIVWAALLKAQVTMVQDFYPGPLGGVSESMAATAEAVFIAAQDKEHGQELWRTDGTCPGTYLVKDINPGPDASNPGNFTHIGSSVVFTAITPEWGRELWVSDGTGAGTHLAKDLTPGATSSYPSQFTTGSNLVFFTVETPSLGNELWRTDAAGNAAVVKDMRTGSASSDPYNLTIFKGNLYFVANASSNGISLWKTDGFVTELVYDPLPTGQGGYVRVLGGAGDSLYLVVETATSGRELWKTNGTAADVKFVKDINPGPGHAFNILKSVARNNRLYFPAADGVHGEELWVTDGTEAGTYMVKDIYVGPNNSSINYMVATDSIMFFSAGAAGTGFELFKSDGTEVGTVLVKDILPGSQSVPSDLTVLGELVYFRALSSGYGRELWRSDGTEAGTVMVADINPGSADGNPYGFTPFNGELYFKATNVESGIELWRTGNPPAGPPLVVEVDHIVPASCYYAQDGAIYLNIVQGTCPYRFKWGNYTYKYTQNLLDEGGGTYDCTITDANGYQVVLTGMVIPRPDNLYGTYADETPPDCRGNTGSFTVSVTGGTQPYTYAWSNGETGTSQSNIPYPGATYTLTLTDAHGCSFTQSYGTYAQHPYIWGFEYKPVTCYGDTIWIREGIPTKPEAMPVEDYIYHWEAGGGGIILSNPDTLEIQVIGPGMFYLTITDESNGCSTTRTVDIGVDSLAPLANAGPDREMLCTADTDTLFGAISNNGHPDPWVQLTWQWTALDGGSFVGYPGTLAPLIDHSGTYILTVKNEYNGCIDRDTAVVTATLDSPPLSVSGSHLNCLNPTVTLTATVETGNTVFEGWWGPDGFISTDLAIVVSAPGTYRAALLDTVNGCRGTADFTVLQRYPVYIDYVYGATTTCPNDDSGWLQVIFGGGSGEYAFLWSNGETTATISELPAGIYTVTITDSEGCSAEASAEVIEADYSEPFLFLQPATFSLAANGQVTLDPQAFDAGSFDDCGIVEWSVEPAVLDCSNIGQNIVTVTIVDAGGYAVSSETFAYVEDNIAPELICPDPVVTGSCEPVVFFDPPQVVDNCPADPQHLVQTAGLPSGSEFHIGVDAVIFQYTDPGGQVAECSFTVEVALPAALAIDAAAISCANACDGALNVLIDGTPPFTAVWSTGQSGFKIENLCAGTYSVTVTDGFGCTYTGSRTLGEPPALQLGAVSVTNDQSSQGIGAIDITVGGGVPPYTFAWYLGAQQVGDTEDLEGLFAGEYRCVITDAHGCTLETAVIEVDNLSGVAEADWMAGCYLVPNPATQFVRIVTARPLPDEVVIQLFSTSGSVIPAVWRRGNGGLTELDVYMLPPGVYEVRLTLNRQRVSRKLVIVH